MYLFGASGHGKVITDILNANGIDVQAYVDDNREIEECYGNRVLHDATGLSPIIVSVGANNVRKEIVKRLIFGNHNIEFGIAIHPSAVISPSAKIGEGTVVMAGAVINACAVIGRHCIVNTGATVDHDCVIEDYCHIAPGVNVSGSVHIGECTWIGVGSCVIQCVEIGKNCMIGAGSVVVRNIPDGVTAYGNPARIKVIKQNNDMGRVIQTREGGKK